LLVLNVNSMLNFRLKVYISMFIRRVSMAENAGNVNCEICGKENVSLYYAMHKDFNRVVRMCRDCWVEAYTKNRLVSDSGSSGGCSCSG